MPPKNPSILIVDDAKAVRQLVENLLQPFRVEVREASNGFNALFVMEKDLPDLLILDVKMPVMDGLELLRMMKSHATLKTVPVIMLPSRPDHPIMPELEALGPAAIVLKPFTPDALLGRIRGVLTLAGR